VIALLAGLALAGEFTWQMPTAEEPAALDCPAFVDLVPGQPVPPSLLTPDGLVRCRATVTPPTDLEYLLRVQAWSEQAEPRGRKLVLEVGWQTERADRYKVMLEKPVPWHQRPNFQRWAGRLEVLAGVALAVIVLDASTEVVP